MGEIIQKNKLRNSFAEIDSWVGDLTWRDDWAERKLDNDRGDRQPGKAAIDGRRFEIENNFRRSGIQSN